MSRYAFGFRTDKMPGSTTRLFYKLVYLCFGLPTITHVMPFSLPNAEGPPRIGIIGAGIGGTSCAYFLREFFGSDVHIDVYEANKVGGRTALTEIGGLKYESGAVFIHKKSKYMTHFNELLKGDKSDYVPRTYTNFAIYNSDGLVLQGSDSPALTTAKLTAKYGSDLSTVQNWIQNVIFPKFERIYTLQEEGIAYTTTEDLLRGMSEDFVAMTNKSIEEVLHDDMGIGRPFIQDMVYSVMRGIYGQTPNAHGVVGAMSLTFLNSEMFSVIGGNKNIPEFLLSESNATLINGKVETVRFVKENNTNRSSYVLNYTNPNKENSETQTGSKEYDIVILATPINGTRNEIRFVDFPSPVTNFSQEFHRTVTMFVKNGIINETTFNIKEQSELPPVVYTNSDKMFYDHLGTQLSVHSTEENSTTSWEAFLNHVPTIDEIGKLFQSFENMEVITDWLAYPEYKPKMDLPPFVLNERLYYINAIESAASALEMSSVGAKNVALLAFNQWYDNVDKIDKIPF